jgi:hypothetical protein
MNEPNEEPIINTLDDAQFWISVMHRRTVSDASRIADLYEQLAKVKRIPILGWWLRR